jgi:hypothetical protein
LGNIFEFKNLIIKEKNSTEEYNSTETIVLFDTLPKLQKPTKLTPFRQLNLTIGSRDRLTPSFLTKTVKNFS